MADEIRRISNTEAIDRILEGRHPEFVEHDNKLINSVLLECLQDGSIFAGIRESDGKLMFSTNPDHPDVNPDNTKET